MSDGRKQMPGTVDFPAPEGLAEHFGLGERQILERVNARVAAGNSLDEVLSFLFEQLRAVIPFDRLGVAFLEEEGARVACRYAKTRYEPVLLGKGYAADLQGSTLQGVLASGRPRVIPDLALYARAHPRSESTRLLLKEGVRSSMTCPLVAFDRPLGFLFFSSRYPGVYGDREVGLHLKIAERLAQAVDKAWRMDQLDASKHAYLELLGFVSHELKAPLASLIFEGRVLAQGYAGAMDERQRQVVLKMVRKAELLLGLTRDYLDLSRLEGGLLQVRPRPAVDVLAGVVDPAVELVQAQFDERHMTLTRNVAAGPVAWDCDPDLMRIVLVNLLSNAAKYGNGGGRVELALSRGEGTVSASVWNEGPGFTEDQRRSLFRKFSRLSTPELMRKRGTGVGLYTSWWIVRKHGGRIWAESEEGRWARFNVELPQPLPARGTAPDEGERP